LKPKKPDRGWLPRLAVFHREFREDLKHWVATDLTIALRILELVEAVLRDPFDGIGKPEPLDSICRAAGRAVSQRSTDRSASCERSGSTS